MNAHMSKILLAYWRTKHQWAPIEKKCVRMGNSAHLYPIRGDHKNRGVNRRKNDIDNRIEQDTKTVYSNITRRYLLMWI